MTAVQPPGRYGALSLDGHLLKQFQEKPVGDGGWINGGFFVLEPSVFEFLDGDSCTWEAEPLNALATKGQLNAYFHWLLQPMDTLGSSKFEALWATGNAPWKVWS